MLGSIVRVTVAACVVAAAPISARAHSLADALAYAYEHSNLLEQQRFLLRATDENVAIATSALRPSLSFFSRIQQNGVSGPTDSLSSTIGLQIEMTLLDGGQRASRIAAAQWTVKAARQGLVEAEQQVLGQAVNAFLTLRQDIQDVSLRENNLRLITQQLRAAEDRFDVGEVTRTDVSIARARLAAARSALAAAQGQVAVSRSAYLLAIGRDAHALIAPPVPPALPASLDAARQIALRGHPSITRLQHTVKANEFQALAADQDRIGQLGASGTLSSADISGSSRDDASLTLSFNQPLYSGGRLSASSRQALALLHASRAELAQQGLIVANGVEAAWAGLAVAQAQVTASRQQVRAAQLAFDGTREEANLGARTTLDVLNAEQELLDARTSALEAETQAYSAVYNVLASMGLLTAEHLGLSVEHYDPDTYFNAVSGAPATSSEYGSALDRVLRRAGRLD